MTSNDDFKHNNICVDGLDWHWVEMGTGHPVVLLHGIPESWACWKYQIPKLAKQFLSAYPNAKWEILWSISSDIAFNTKPSENWVTTCVTVTYGEGDEATTLQRIIDAQIVDGKIKLVYGYERSALY